MAKCPKCLQRKGKRECPALDEMICSLCCATYRLQEIRCPEDCPHLGSEHYQHQRRRQKAEASGRDFLDALIARFGREGPPVDIAFRLHADAYYFMSRRGEITDDQVLRSFEQLEGELGGILVADQLSMEPLAEFIASRLADKRRYPESTSALRRVVKSVRDSVEALMRSRRGPDSKHRYREQVASYFDALDFVSDLDYDPFEDALPPPSADKRSEGGLILP